MEEFGGLEEIGLTPEQLLEALQQDQIIAPALEREAGLSGPPQKRRATECEVCHEQAAKYTCPGCSMRSCSLDCVKNHKGTTGCTGKRSCEFYTVSEMNENTLRDDFFFLKEVERLSGDSHRNSSRQGKNTKRSGPKGRNHSAAGEGDEPSAEATPIGGGDGDIQAIGPGSDVQSTLPVALRKLVSEAADRGVTLRLLPRGMTRRKSNTTFYAYRNKKLFWRVEWVLHGEPIGSEITSESSSEPVRLTTDRVEDCTLVNDAFEPIWESLIATSNSGDSSFSVSERKKLRERLTRLLAPGRSDIIFLIPKYNTTADRPSYYRIDGTRSLAENLSGRIVIEFPSFLVVPLADAHTFTIEEA